MARSLVGLGANLGSRAETLAASLAQLTATPGIALLSASSLHETSPVGGPADQPAFLNQAALLETSLAPLELWQRLSQIEQSAGRTRPLRWGPRTLDLDLLLYDQQVVSLPQLQVPHPRLALRDFVLTPVVEIAPDWVHPQIGWTMAELWRHLRTAPPYLAIAGPPGIGKSALARRLAQQFNHRLVEISPARNSPGTPPGPPLKSLRLAAQTLDRQHFSEPSSHWTVSSFWFDQLPLQYSDPAYLQAWQELLPQVQPPKLLIHLDHPRDPLVPDALPAQIAALTAQPGIGPVLHLSAADPDTVWSETIAAIHAMTPPEAN